MARKRKGDPIHGWVNFDKPYEMGSTQAVGKVRWLYQAQKAGHAGTLDPLATGILPIALGDATKTVAFMVNAAKSYEVTISWGESTTTQDVEGEVNARSDVRPTRAAIEAALPEFIGDISQVPPKFSAIKVNGKRAYDLARDGIDVELKSRIVHIDAIEILDCQLDHVSLAVECGKGTYIRSLARDLAHILGTEGHVTRLRRTRVGPFTQSNAFSLDSLESLVHKARVLEALMPVKTALDDIPVLAVTETESLDLKHGRAIAPVQQINANDHPSDPSLDDDDEWILAEFEGTEIALCQRRDGLIKPKRVFNI